MQYLTIHMRQSLHTIVISSLHLIMQFHHRLVHFIKKLATVIIMLNLSYRIRNVFITNINAVVVVERKTFVMGNRMHVLFKVLV